MRIVIKDIFLKQMLNTQKVRLIFARIFQFNSKEKKIKKCKKLICNIRDKEKDIVHIRVLKQALNQGLILKKVLTEIQFHQKEQLKPYIDMSTQLRKETKNDFEKDFLN